MSFEKLDSTIRSAIPLGQKPASKMPSRNVTPSPPSQPLSPDKYEREVSSAVPKRRKSVRRMDIQPKSKRPRPKLPSRAIKKRASIKITMSDVI